MPWNATLLIMDLQTIIIEPGDLPKKRKHFSHLFWRLKKCFLTTLQRGSDKKTCSVSLVQEHMQCITYVKYDTVMIKCPSLKLWKKFETVCYYVQFHPRPNLSGSMFSLDQDRLKTFDAEELRHFHTNTDPKERKITSRFQVRLKNTPGSLRPCDQWPAWLWGLIIQPLSTGWHPWGSHTAGPHGPHTPLMCLIKSDHSGADRTSSICGASTEHTLCPDVALLRTAETRTLLSLRPWSTTHIHTNLLVVNCLSPQKLRLF